MMRINAFDYFRAIAIVFIVLGHSYGYWERELFSEQLVNNIITGGTTLFVFISGFFFHHVFYTRFNFNKFLIKKSQFVFVPYLIITFSLLFVSLFLNSDLTSYKEVLSFNEWLGNMFTLVFVTGVVSGHWYIPFVMLIFLASPFFISFIHQALKRQLLIILITFGISLFLQRPEQNMNVLHSFLYFIPIYLIGITVSLHHKKVLNFIRLKLVYLFALTFIVASIQVLYTDTVGNYVKSSMLVYNGIDLMLIQKLFMIFFFLALLSHLENREIPVLKRLADMSFAIFFLHGVILLFLNKIHFGEILAGHVNGFGFFIINSILVISLAIVVAILIRSVFGKRSKYLIGW